MQNAIVNRVFVPCGMFFVHVAFALFDSLSWSDHVHSWVPIRICRSGIGTMEAPYHIMIHPSVYKDYVNAGRYPANDSNGEQSAR